MLHALFYDATWINKLAPGISDSRPSQRTVESQDMTNKASQHIPYTF